VTVETMNVQLHDGSELRDVYNTYRLASDVEGVRMSVVMIRWNGVEMCTVSAGRSPPELIIWAAMSTEAAVK